jgi:hypothetical protein
MVLLSGSGCSVVFVDHTAEYAALDQAVDGQGGWPVLVVGCALVESLVRPVRVVVPGVLGYVESGLAFVSLGRTHERHRHRYSARGHPPRTRKHAAGVTTTVMTHRPHWPSTKIRNPMYHKAFLPLAVLPLVALTALAACSGGGSPARVPTTPTTSTAASGGIPPGHTSGAADSGGSCKADVVAGICVTAAITGAVSVSGTGATTAPAPAGAPVNSTCADLATLNHRGERNLGAGVNLSGHTVMWDDDLSHFTGPGTYDLSEFYFTIDDSSFTVNEATKASVTVRPDFSVTYTFTGLKGDVGTISGTLSWTCANPT